MEKLAMDASAAAVQPKSFRWGFFSASAVVLLAMLAGEAAGRLYDPYWRHLKAGWIEWRALTQGYLPEGALRFGSFGGWIDAYRTAPGLSLIDAVLWLFVGSTALLLWMLRVPLLRFLRSMYAGVALVAWTTIAVGAGVVVPQIKNFEDPEERVTAQNEQAEFEDFAWAEAFFIYHLTHLYGLGMPDNVQHPALPPEALAGLERFGEVYGKEEQDNRQKQMLVSFSQREKNIEIEAFLERHHDALRTAFAWCTKLSLNRAYKSWWFLTLMCVLASAVAANLLKLPVRSWFSIQKAGFALTHMGLLVTLAGGSVSKACTDRGILQLDLREPPQNTYFRHYTETKLGRLPFSVRLDHFGRRDWEALEVWFPEEQFSSNPPRYTLWPGRRIELDYAPDESGDMRPRLALEVLELPGRAQVGLPLVREGAADQEPLPLVEVEVPQIERSASSNPALEAAPVSAGTRRLYLSPVLQNRGYNDPLRAFRLVTDFGTQDPLRLFPLEDGVIGQLSVEVVGENDGAPIQVPVRLGTRASLPGGFQAEFLGATSNFQLRRASAAEEFEQVVDARPLAEQPLGTRMLRLRLIPPGGDGKAAEERLVIEGFDMRQQGKQSSYTYDTVFTNFRWDTWRAPGPPRYVLQWGQGEPRLISQQGTRLAVRPGEPLPIPGGSALLALGFYERAQLEQNIEFLPELAGEDGWDADFYTRDPRGLLLEVTHFPGNSKQVVEQVRMASTEASGSDVWWAGDERFVLRFLENSEMMPYEWRSVLSILEPDGDGNPRVVPLGSERQREIRVNDYFTYEGYRFFQTDARSDIPTYSGIGVVYDPGIPIVISGMWIVIGGMATAFLLRPIALGRRKEHTA